MKLSDAAARAEKLRVLINDYRYHYHVLDESIMSESAADGLKHELAEIEAEYPDLITPDSPTQVVAGAPKVGFEKVTHTARMLSLNDVFNRIEVEAWAARVDKLLNGASFEFFADVKMDGLACALWYEDGVLTRAVTRGDGFVGEDVTANVMTIDSVPRRLRTADGYEQFLQGRTEIRGEIIIYKSDFAALNAKRAEAGEAQYANPRNLAAGSIRQLDPRLAAERPLRFRAWDIFRDDASDLPTYEYAYSAIRALGVAANPRARALKTIDDVMNFANEQEAKREEFKFNIDGLVIKLNDRAQYVGLGAVGKAPRGAVAYKYAAEEAVSVVRDIVLSIGRTGAATPVAVFDPVVVAGTTVRHASLHNADEIARKDIRVGDTVIVYKAGDIIPQVQEVLKELRPESARAFDYEAELKRQYPELSFERPEGEVVYRVVGATSNLLLKQALRHFASKGSLDIDTLGEKNVAVLVDSGLVQDLADIYTLSIEQVTELDRFADISARKLVEAIADKRTPSLERFIFGLGIRHVGAQTAIDVADKFGSLEALRDTSLEDLESIDGVGTVVAESILAWFSDDENLALLDKFTELGVLPVYDSSKTKGKLAGQFFVVTGTLESMSREVAADKIRSLGGTFQTSVAKDTTYLVAGDNVGASKLKKASDYGTKILTEQEFLDILK